uniref:Uncharacterized protein n=1 Tax=Chromera velia CCMP2878 TaxID=1169474 RepID=A0A0G4G8S4_9ALVE|eukprot:Cvel_20748.t1-p1 / transcript=Cvel_20748.t1 / gene=Cvel_20748 / organism=Chromera_velia_CCMP2878 / gene_product=hypothetical protein / transcript_product=hypothetical protein / location=Cvel_scaffold1890:20341-22733(+) / protein_length=336 / sequence_SO=supercontig / SO=protein_coding / is_pseudo=false
MGGCISQVEEFYFAFPLRAVTPSPPLFLLHQLPPVLHHHLSVLLPLPPLRFRALWECVAAVAVDIGGGLFRVGVAGLGVEKVWKMKETEVAGDGRDEDEEEQDCQWEDENENSKDNQQEDLEDVKKRFQASLAEELLPAATGRLWNDANTFFQRKKKSNEKLIQLLEQIHDRAETLVRSYLQRDCGDGKGGWKAKGMTVLFSDWRYEEQLPHADFRPSVFRLCDKRLPFASLLIPLTGIMKLRVWPGKRATGKYVKRSRKDGKLLVVKPGEAVIFRGDIIHGGEAYKWMNARLFLFLGNFGGEAPDESRFVKFKGNVHEEQGKEKKDEGKVQKRKK